MKNVFSAPGFLWFVFTIIFLAVLLFGLTTALNRTGWQKNRRRKVIIGFLMATIGWISLISILSMQGFFLDFNRLPPRTLLAMLIPLPLVIGFVLSKTGSQILYHTPAHWLIFMQSFRIIVEVLIWIGFLRNLLPVQMSFEGSNVDILTGLLAIPAGYFIWKKPGLFPRIVYSFNVVGLVFLINIVIISILSMPSPIRHFMNEPSSRVVGEFPFIFLPAVLVPIAYSLHIFSFRQFVMWRNRRSLAVN